MTRHKALQKSDKPDSGGGVHRILAKIRMNHPGASLAPVCHTPKWDPLRLGFIKQESLPTQGRQADQRAILLSLAARGWRILWSATEFLLHLAHGLLNFPFDLLCGVALYRTGNVVELSFNLLNLTCCHIFLTHGVSFR